MLFAGLDSEEAKAFAEKWLPAWTGNQPERLASFYTDDAFYSDPAIPCASPKLDPTRLRAKNGTLHQPAPVWFGIAHQRSHPVEMLFLLKLILRALRALALSRRTLLLENLALRQQLATIVHGRRRPQLVQVDRDPSSHSIE